MNSKNILIVLGVLVILGLGFYFLKMRGSYKTVTTTSTPAASGQPTASGLTIVIQNFKYSPSTLTVKAGDVITFTNMDSAPHSIVSDDGSSFSTGELSQGQSTTFTAPSAAGTYPFHCRVHPSITGTIVVQ